MNISSKDLITNQFQLQNKEVERLASPLLLKKVKHMLNQEDFYSRVTGALLDIEDYDESLKTVQEILNERKKFLEKIIKKQLIY
jgi:hypothetical protein